ncbi:MAG: hypothetical protein JNL88_02815 [Bacteroidia bacterium]|nr:hypothetical protein [Bacteroidia bacterium]
MKKFGVFRLYVLLMLLPVFTSIEGKAQDSVSTRFRHHGLYFELFGSGGMYTINYEYRFNEHWSARAGFSTWSLSLIAWKFGVTAWPLLFNRLSGQDGNYLETGLGIMPTTLSFTSGENIFSFEDREKQSKTILLGTAFIGYRMQPVEERYFLRIGFTPLFTFEEVLPTGGISAGFTF